MQRRAAEVRASSARKAERQAHSGSDSEDDYYDLLASRERVKNGRVTLEGVADESSTAEGAKERRRKAFNLPAGTPGHKSAASPISATIRDVFAEYTGEKAHDVTAGVKSPGRPWTRPQPLEQSYGEALRDIYALTPAGKRQESGERDAAAERAVSSRTFAAERAAEAKAEEFRRYKERERSFRESSLGPAAFLAAGKEPRSTGGGGGGGGGSSSPISNVHVSPVSYVQGTLREAMADYATSSGGGARARGHHRSPTPRAPPSQTSQPPPGTVSFSAPLSSSRGGGAPPAYQAEGGALGGDSEGSALLYTTLNGDARRVSRSLDELKQANLSLTSGLRDLQKELEQERHVFESKFGRGVRPSETCCLAHLLGYSR